MSNLLLSSTLPGPASRPALPGVGSLGGVFRRRNLSLGRRRWLQPGAQAGLVLLLVLAGGWLMAGCVPTLASAEGKEKTVAPFSPASGLTEAGIIYALNGQWWDVNGLPAHFTMHAAPFEIVGQGPAGAKLRVHVWLRCTQDSFEPVRQVFSPAGKAITIVRQVFARGQLIEIPLQVDDATMNHVGGVNLGTRFERSPKAWGQPWNFFANPVDLATEKGARIAAAPKEIADGERWLNEQQARKADRDMLMRAIETHDRNSLMGAFERDSILAHYPEAHRKFSAIRVSTDFTQFQQELLRWQEEIKPIIRADFEQFDAEYLEMVRKVAAAKKLLADG